MVAIRMKTTVRATSLGADQGLVHYGEDRAWHVWFRRDGKWFRSPSPGDAAKAIESVARVASGSDVTVLSYPVDPERLDEVVADAVPQDDNCTVTVPLEAGKLDGRWVSLRFGPYGSVTAVGVVLRGEVGRLLTAPASFTLKPIPGRSYGLQMIRRDWSAAELIGDGALEVFDRSPPIAIRPIDEGKVQAEMNRLAAINRNPDRYARGTAASNRRATLAAALAVLPE